MIIESKIHGTMYIREKKNGVFSLTTLGPCHTYSENLASKSKDQCYCGYSEDEHIKQD